MTPEEESKLRKEIDDSNKKIAEFEAKGVATAQLEAQVKTMGENLTSLQDENKKNKSELAIRDAIAEFPLAGDFKDLIRGNTPEEIKAAAKSVHERQAKTLEQRGVKPNNGLDAWKSVPGSVPSELLIADDRKEQYDKVRAAKLPLRQKVVTMMAMKIEDLHKNYVLDARKKLGIH